MKRKLGFYVTSFAIALTAIGPYEILEDRDSISTPVVVYRGQNIQLTVPSHPLAKGSLYIEPIANIRHYADWSREASEESYTTLQKVAAAWKNADIASEYMIYGKETKKEDSTFGWEIIPAPKDGWAFWHQLKVFWRISFGGPKTPTNEMKNYAEIIGKALEKESIPNSKSNNDTYSETMQRDPFCNEQVIAKQIIFEGKAINILYNYAPIAVSKQQLHFLIVPKAHRQFFSDLTKEEYQEATALTQKVIKYYRAENPTVYIYDKSGRRAGQTVDHWHRHMVFTASKTEELWGKLYVLKNMVFRSKPLADSELKVRVTYLRDNLGAYLNSQD